MSAAAAPRLTRELSVAEGTSGPRANRRDVDHTALGRTACQVYGALCDCLDYSRYTGLVWPRVGTLARRLHITERTVQRGLEELVLSGWIGTPCGDVGGSREGLLYHLHPNGKSCLFCVAAARTLNQRGKRPSASATGDILTPNKGTGDTMTPVVATGDKVSPVRVDLDSNEIASTGDKSTPVETPRGDILAARGDKNDSTYKERRSLKTLSKSSSSSTREQVPLEFAELMNQETQLDRGALLRLWQETHEILPDATCEEIRHWFHERAVTVYRNRRLENPTGLMLTTIHDWFEPRRVLERRRELQQADAEFEGIRNELGELGIVIPAQKQAETARREVGLELRDQIAQAARRKGLR